MSSLPDELPTKIDFNLVSNIQTYEEKNYCELAAELQNRKKTKSIKSVAKLLLSDFHYMSAEKRKNRKQPKK